MRIIVGTKNSHKLEAVESACGRVGIKAPKILGLKIPSGQNEQPVGLEETYEGALARAVGAQKEFIDPWGIFVGIESGIVRIQPTAYVDLAVVVVITSERRIVATSSGVGFPYDYVATARIRGFETTTVGSVIAEKTGCDGTDPHSTLTHGKVSRKDILVQALTIALSQV
ncbi:MAG: hypothetical protein A2599_00090 [Candidatus Staskawiczbacteria bacterium RIFOXYD1_FULL_39_28]|uniref:inosine/xanthosine triphosphatase n=1 Tax=Candidatus Staskawiczbacteria bacterium RIFOXYC1_FULL_38_18 TaxID=1802229 RepID=A0A1G2JB95_9BACT|nr:MAG: hypothetical protein A2401_03565 [Candidatus Staskawiczbacteria bacterium RIFOXYC1_FULL_38_18]OGZ92219.1 MAG: hypothetical protein A2599_00090 [Candidatus Staskawiczbacteria bacterium RIFOXYD1_FULL_39_28]